ncbi:MAG: molybdenum ABC transporter ATP-binding protein, partial [Nitrospinaceae bacterium]
LRAGEEVWQEGSRFVPPHQRPVGLVFQEPRLFSHRSVWANLIYGYRRVPPEDRKIHPEDILDLLDLRRLLDQRAPTLSGGEQQRVAIGRALLTSPRLLLLDEPMANLDAARKQEILPFLLRLRREMDLPMVYVSHGIQEVLQLMDTLVLLEEGRIQASGPAGDVLRRLGTTAGSGAALAGTLLDTRVDGHEPEFGLTRLTFNGQTLYVPQRNLSIGSPLRLHLKARDVSLMTGPQKTTSSVLNVLEGTVLAVGDFQADGVSVDILVNVGEPLLARITRKSLVHLGLQPGQRVWAYIKALRMVHEEAEE